jgi:UMF1 family MFS transporter
MGQFFGLFAFSGKATAFLAPIVIGIATQLMQSQRSGVATVIAFLVLGLVLMAWVASPSGQAGSGVVRKLRD